MTSECSYAGGTDRCCVCSSPSLAGEVVPASSLTCFKQHQKSFADLARRGLWDCVQELLRHLTTRPWDAAMFNSCNGLYADRPSGVELVKSYANVELVTCLWGQNRARKVQVGRGVGAHGSTCRWL